MAPGGVGTMDELFEVLMLKKSGKVPSDLPVVLFGKQFWQTVVNWSALIKFGEFSQEEYDDLFFSDSPDEAYQFIVDRLKSNAKFDISSPTA